MEFEKQLNKDNIDIVLYHGSCIDGFGSAFIVRLYHKQKFGTEKADQIKYIPCYHQKTDNLKEEFLVQMKDKNILMCDFSYKYTQLIELIAVSKSFLILDHHKTAQSDLEKIQEHYKIFDMKKSGVGITWQYFFPDIPLPQFLAHIQDRDIWSYQIPKTHEFITYFHEQDFDFDSWESYLDEKNVQDAIDIGEKWIGYQNVMINKIIKKTSCLIQKINGQSSIVLYCNSPELKSDLGNRVFKMFSFGDFSCIWDYDLLSDRTSYSLRSTDDRYDVSKIATDFGGGGHRNASGLSLTGMNGKLPYEVIPDNGLISLLMRKYNGKFMFSGEEKTYTLFKVKEIKSEWLEEDYLSLIKRKCNDSIFIVFEKPSGTIDFDPVTEKVTPLKEYAIYYNEKSTTDPIKQLQYIACGSKDHAITFKSAEDFSTLFHVTSQEKSTETPVDMEIDNDLAEI